MRKTILILSLLLITVSIFAIFGKKKGISEGNVVFLRKGPASHFHSIGILPKNAVFSILGKELNWYKINFADSIGYLPQKAIREISEEELQNLGKEEKNTRFSSIDLSKIDKLAYYFCEKFGGDKKFISYYKSLSIDENRFAKFKKTTYKGFNLKNNLKKIPLTKGKDGEFSQTELGIGLGIGSAVASGKFYHNPIWSEYINFVGNQIVETSDIYDWNFKFFILNTSEAGTITCPGGIIFVSKGLLESIETEAELAFVLAREIASSSHYFGMNELFSEKDKFENLVLSDTEWEKITQDSIFLKLNETVSRIHEKIFEEKTSATSEAADYLGLIYAARAGYNSRKAINLFERLLLVEPPSLTDDYSISQIRKRLEAMKSNPNKLVLPKKLFSHKKRWKEKEVFLD
ncbi:MAG: hypothetical protein DRZ79_02700 [Candidatus Cloacimonadota bacterium]|nr:MAG: hypothetical protein DRZ79_02700 [Candidatus Cloacimonadota bacterium]